MPKMSFPSDTFPSLTSISLEAADQWSPIDVPVAVLALRRTVEPGAFVSNLMVVVQRTTADGTQAEVVAAYLARQQQRLDAVVTRTDTVAIGGADFLAHEMTFTAPTGESSTIRVTQSTLIGLVDRGRVRDLVEVTGTVAADRADRDHLEVQTMLASLTIG